jgi:hypothetical protein
MLLASGESLIIALVQEIATKAGVQLPLPWLAERWPMKNTKATSDPSKPLEFEPDAWERFRRAVSIVARAPPQHRPGKRAIHRAPGAKKKSLGLRG